MYIKGHEDVTRKQQNKIKNHNVVNIFKRDINETQASLPVMKRSQNMDTLVLCPQN